VTERSLRKKEMERKGERGRERERERETERDDDDGWIGRMRQVGAGDHVEEETDGYHAEIIDWVHGLPPQARLSHLDFGNQKQTKRVTREVLRFSG